MSIKRLILTVLLAIACMTVTYAVPAYPGLLKFVQPDGTVIDGYLHGDEWMHFATTTDGYTIVQDSQQRYVYAKLQDGKLVPTTQLAHNVEARTAQEKSFLNGIDKMLKPEATKISQVSKPLIRRASIHDDVHYDYTKFRGLVILVNYTDRKFSYPTAVIDSMINQEGFKGFMSLDSVPEFQPCTGSVRDYFTATSAGLFKPKFDVIGPVNVPRTSTYVNQYNNAQTLFKQVLDSANALVDYSKYDTDSDGVVDMVFFIVAGSGSHYGNGNRLWPHASVIEGKTLDGVSFGRYACSVEERGIEDISRYPDYANNPEYKLQLDGVGTICHEFSHVLGLRDEYDADYSTNGKCPHPGDWSIMASGCYLNLSRTPCGYSLLERYQAGFTAPETINKTGKYSLENIMTSNGGYRIDTPQEDEFFLLENRQQEGWDQYLPGHGMLIFRVDSTNTAASWAVNRINNDASHPYYELLRAGGEVKNPSTNSSASLLLDEPSDPFPGTKSVTSIDNTTTPSLKSWAGLENEVSLSGIQENNGVITFTATKEEIPQVVEDFETMDTTVNDTSNVIGRFTTWDFEKAQVVNSDSLISQYIKGSRGARLYRKGTITSGAVPYAVSQLKFSCANPTSSQAYLRAYYSTDNGNNWTMASTLLGSKMAGITAGNETSITFVIGTSSPVRIRIEEFSGNSTSPIYIDNITLRYDSVITTGINEIKETRKPAKSYYIYDIAGRPVAVGGSQKAATLPKGIYIIDGKKIIK